MDLPMSPTTVRVCVRMSADRGTRPGLIASTASWWVWRFAKSKTLQVHTEDRNIYADQQQGLEISPHRGVIGTHEERLYAFQRYLLESLDLPVPNDFDEQGRVNKQPSMGEQQPEEVREPFIQTQQRVPLVERAVSPNRPR